MSTNTRLGLGILGGALALGVVGDALLRVTPWGLNAPFWIALLLLAVVGLVRWQGLEVAASGRWLALTALLFAGAVAWRDSSTLRVSNVLAVIAALSLGAFYLRGGRLARAGLVEYGLGGALVGLHAAGGWLPLALIDVKWREVSTDRSYGMPLAVGRGLVIALPLLLIFGGLFVAADAMFEGLVTAIFRWSIVELISHLVLVGFWSWIVGGVMRVALLAQPWRPPTLSTAGPLSLGIVEIGIVLGLLDALFLAFVATQLRWFFGGAATVIDPTGPTYAEYARRGFFELVTVGALVLPLLLLGHWQLRRRRAADEQLFRLLAGFLIAMLFVIMASALLRMQLYTSIYGLTELRIYTTAFMLWLAIVCGWFLVTVLRGQRERFAIGALTAAFLALGVLDAINPDAWIVAINAQRTEAVEPVDVRYVARLSADAIPTVVAVLPGLPAAQRIPLAVTVLANWSAPAGVDPRSWSWGRYQAWQAVETNRTLLERLAAGWPPSASPPAR